MTKRKRRPEEILGVRLVWRVADMMFDPWPGLEIVKCSRCAAPCYIDPAQPVPPGITSEARVCVPCGLKDPELRPEIERVHRNAQAAKATFRAS